MSRLSYETVTKNSENVRIDYNVSLCSLHNFSNQTTKEEHQSVSMGKHLSDEELIPLLNGILKVFMGTNLTISELAEIAHKQINEKYGLRKRKCDTKKVDYYCLGRLRLFIGNLKNNKPLR